MHRINVKRGFLTEKTAMLSTKDLLALTCVGKAGVQKREREMGKFIYWGLMS